jgi:xanthine dehydrogenase YagR molybdenum-binding subunit
VGSAVHQAGRQWKQRLLEFVAADIGCEPGVLDIVDGVIVGTGQPAMPVADALRLGGSTLLDELTFDATSSGAPEDGPVSQSFGAHFCEVEVDEDIGRVTVTRWVAVFDCGRVLNPKLARSQVMGGIMFGLGMALLEQVPYDAHTAQLIGEYYVPTHADRPDFDISFIDSADYTLDPIGVRGIGEIGACGVPAAIANAVFHATGKRIRDLPITLEKIMTPYTRLG